MLRSIARIGLALVLVASSHSANAQTPKHTLQTINVVSASSSPYKVAVGDVVQVTLTNQNVGGLPASKVVAGSGNALSPIGAIVLDSTTTPGTYIAFYSVASLGGSTVTFTYNDTSGGTAKTVTKTLLFDVPATGTAAIWDVNGNTGSPGTLPNVKVGDVIRLTYRATSPTQTISSGVTPTSTGVTPSGATFDGTTYIAFFAATQPGTATIGLSAGGGAGAVILVTVTPPTPGS